jgi:hypothetical protein
MPEVTEEKCCLPGSVVMAGVLGSDLVYACCVFAVVCFLRFMHWALCPQWNSIKSWRDL